MLYCDPHFINFCQWQWQNAVWDRCRIVSYKWTMDWVGSPGGVKYRAAYAANNKLNVLSQWQKKRCLRRMSHKWIGWVGWDWKSPGGVKFRAWLYILTRMTIKIIEKVDDRHDKDMTRTMMVVFICCCIATAFSPTNWLSMMCLDYSDTMGHTK